MGGRERGREEGGERGREGELRGEFKGTTLNREGIDICHGALYLEYTRTHIFYTPPNRLTCDFFHASRSSVSLTSRSGTRNSCFVTGSVAIAPHCTDIRRTCTYPPTLLCACAVSKTLFTNLQCHIHYTNI